MPASEAASPARAISSLQNASVKAIRALEMRKVRRQTGLFVAEGASLIITARQAGWPPRSLVFLAGSAHRGQHGALIAWARLRLRRLLRLGARRRRWEIFTRRLIPQPA